MVALAYRNVAYMDCNRNLDMEDSHMDTFKGNVNDGGGILMDTASAAYRISSNFAYSDDSGTSLPLFLVQLLVCFQSQLFLFVLLS
jgi:hypothetical protein